MQSKLALSLLLALPSLIAALGLDGDDIPRACTQACAPLVQLSAMCDRDDDIVGDGQEERLERDCICGETSFDVAGVTADCAACVGGSGEFDDFDDIQEIIRACRF